MSRWLVSTLPSWLLLLGMVVVIAGAAMLVQFFVRQRFPNLRGEDTMVAILGVLVAAQLFLVLDLSHPFIGEIATSPQPLHEVIDALNPT